MCIPCDKAREFPGHTMHCPSCLYCGARAIQRLGNMAIPMSDSNRRRRETLAEWMDWGHSEVDLRRLAKSEDLPLAPIGQDAATASASPSRKKSR